MPKPTVYVETSIVSYLTAVGSRDVVLLAHQELTRTWWASRDEFSLFASRFVRDEASAGDADAAQRHLDALRGIPLLGIREDAIGLASRLVSEGGLPAKARVDALHVAVATVHGMDYLLTWNCKHIANASLRRKIESTCKASGFLPTVICTPYELRNDLMQSFDPIIDELHAIREAIAAAADNDIRKIAEEARSRENEDGVEVVTLPPKRFVEKTAS